ncbi:MAG: hypothetical protein QM751_14045 [Paludibacteraceae bacterium]
MQLHFLLNYRAIWGQTLHLQIFDNSNTLHEYAMMCFSEDKWKISIDTLSDFTPKSYQYIIKNTNGHIQYEYNGLRNIALASDIAIIHFVDFWRGFNGDSAFSTIAFSDCFFKRKKQLRKKKHPI